jgi:Mrp family chromosome partitioning ATPase/capsular polysaccharide biosynthesis protein
MMTMNRTPSQPTARDLLAPLRAHRVLIVVIVALAVGASIAYSATRTRVYQADAEVSYQDETYDLGLVGLSAPATQTSDQVAAAGAQTILQPAVAAHARRILRSPLAPSALLGAVTATVQPNSNLVVIQASAPTAQGAQKLANAFAQQGAEATNAQVRSVYGAAYDTALKQLRGPSGAAQALVAADLSRLRVLSKIATAAQVVRPASLPGAPSSPRPLRDAALAGILGLILALLAAYVRDSFDSRLRSSGDVEEQIALPLLGQVRTDALGSSPSGRGDHLPDPIDWELFQIMRRNVEFLEPGRSIRSVAVTSPMPEEGKSTVASFLALANAAAGKRTLLIECDLRRPTLAARLGAKSAPGLTDYVLGKVQLSDVIQTIDFGDAMSSNGAGPASGGLDRAPGSDSKASARALKHRLLCITAGSPTQHAVEVLRSGALSALLAEVQEAYDLVVLDTPPLLSVVDTLELLPSVQATIVCVRVHQTTHQQARAGKAALSRLPERPTGVVVTGTRRGDQADYGYYGAYP